MTRLDKRIVLAPVLTGALLLIGWTTPRWSDVPGNTAVTVRVEPQLIGAGPTAAPARETGYGVNVEVAEAGAGQPVRLDVWSNGDWAREDDGTTDDRGRVRLESSDGAYGRIVTEVDGSQVTTNFDPLGAGPALWASEEFEGDALGAQWLSIPQPDGGGTCTQSDDRALSVADGQLALMIEERPNRSCRATGRPARLNGHVILRAEIGYGTTAARIKFPLSRAVTGQFWLQPGDPGQRWAMDAKHEGVVVAETAGTDSSPRIGTTVNQLVEGTVERSRRVFSRTQAPTDGRFHVYAVTWTPEQFLFTIDGKSVRTVPATGVTPPLTIGLAMMAPRTSLPTDPDQRTMFVDWLRVWSP